MATNPYVKTVWVNDEAPPINDTNLNHIEQGIYDATAGLIQAEADLALHTTDINTLSDDLDTAEGNITTLQGQVGSHTIARDVLANEYTNAQIDTKIAEVTPVWGSITGTLSNQTDLQTALDSAGKVKAVDGFSPDTTTGNVTTERVLTQAQYNALSEAEKNNGMTYYISDGEGGGGGSTTAAQVSYSNTSSGLSATNVQGAIDEVVSYEELSYTVQSDFNLQSYGWVSALRVGKVAYISFYGVRAVASATSVTGMIQLNGYHAVKSGCAVLYDNTDHVAEGMRTNSAGKLIMAMRTTADHDYMGQITLIVEAD